MNKQVDPQFRHKPLVVFLFHFLLFAYPLLSLLWRRSYPFYTLEVGILFSLLALACLLLTIILANVRPTLINLLSPLLMTIAFMLQFNLLLQGVVLCTLIGLLVAWRFKTNFHIYSLPVLMTLIIGAYLDSSENEGWVSSAGQSVTLNSELPPVVHILMDSFIGIDGLPSYPATEALSKKMYSFFDDYNFQVFPRAYSRYSATGDSLYSALNFRNDGESKFGMEVMSRRQHILRSNSLFDAMGDLGYRFNIYQTGYLDFCRSNPGQLDRCWAYSQPNVDSIRMATDLRLKLKMLVKVLVSQSTLLTDVVVSRRWLLDQGIAYHDPRVFSQLEEDVLEQAAGKYYFAHVLFPHGPYAFMNDCSISYESPLWARYATLENEPVQSDEIYEIRSMKFFEQADCAVKSIGEIFEKMKAAGIFEESIIVIHGDHGSRIGRYRPEYKNLEVTTPANYRAYFSTLFAVKFPHTDGLVDKQVLPLSALLEGFSATIQAHVSSQGTAPLTVAISDSPDRTEPFLYVPGTYPLHRVDINIFED